MEAQRDDQLLALNLHFAARHGSRQLGSDQRLREAALHGRHAVHGQRVLLRGHIAGGDKQVLAVDEPDRGDGLLGLVETFDCGRGCGGLVEQGVPRKEFEFA